MKRAHLRTLHVTRGAARLFGLTPARYDMLYAMWQYHTTRQRDLWEKLHLSRATVSRMLGSLEVLGLVERGEQQGRASRGIRLTKKGLERIKQAYRGCHRPMRLLHERIYKERRSRIERVDGVMDIHRHVIRLGLNFGDRSTLLYEYGTPDDDWRYWPDPTMPRSPPSAPLVGNETAAALV